MQNHFRIWERNLPNEPHLKLPWCELYANTFWLWDSVTLSSFRWAILYTSRPQEKDKKTNGAILVKEHRSGQLGDNLREYFLMAPVGEKVGCHSIMSFILIGPEETAIISDSHQRPHPKRYPSTFFCKNTTSCIYLISTSGSFQMHWRVLLNSDPNKTSLVLIDVE